MIDMDDALSMTSCLSRPRGCHLDCLRALTKNWQIPNILTMEENMPLEVSCLLCLRDDIILTNARAGK